MDVVTKKQQLDAERRMNEASSSTGRHQTTIESSMNVMTTTAVDEAIARFFYGENISFRAVESTLFHEMIAVMRAAPVKYKPPNRKRLGGDLLKATTTHLRTSTGLVCNLVRHCSCFIHSSKGPPSSTPPLMKTPHQSQTSSSKASMHLHHQLLPCCTL